MSKRKRSAPSPSPPEPAAAPAGRRPRRLRAWWMFGGVALVAAGAAWCVWPGETRLEITRTPDQNVLIVTIDTLRADALGSYGGRAATPHLDRLAADGVRYDFAHAHSVVTLPSHVSILTGLYPFQHGVRDNAGFRVPAGTETLATRLRSQGFATGAFIGAFPLDSQFGLDSGFDVYDDRLNEVSGPSDFAFSERRADEVVTSALTWLEERPGKWFAWVHVYDPHAPASPPEPFATQYANNLYAGEVAFTDAALGPLFDRVRAIRGRPTLAVIARYHDEGLGDHGEPTHGVFAYEPTLRVPLIVAQYQDGQPTRGSLGRRPRVSHLAAQHVDILPTIADALALDWPGERPGRSLTGQTQASAALRASYFEALSPSLNRGWAPLTGVMVDRDKFIDLPLPELYDLGRDPGEQTNLIDRVDRRRLLEVRLREFGPTAPGDRRVEDPETAARLRALGYTSGTAAPRKAYTEEDDPKRLIAIDRDMQRAIELFQARRLAEAAGIYRGIIERRPDMAIAYQHLAFLQWESGQPEMAITTLTLARQKAGESAETDTLLGMYLSESGRAAEALPLLERTVLLPDAGVDALNALGIAYERTGQPEKAAETFERLLDVDPRNAMAVQNLGSVHLAWNRLDEAERAFQRALDINPSWAAAYTGLGAVLAKRGDQPGAIDAWTKAVALSPSEFDALFNLATELINAGREREARPYVERFVRTAPPAFYGPDIARLRAWLGASVR